MSFLHSLVKRYIGMEKWNQLLEYDANNKSFHMDKLLFRMIDWHKFDKWYYEKINLQKVDIVSIWPTDYDDMACQAVLYKDGNKVANIIDSYDESTIRYIYGNPYTELNEELIKKSIETLINENFESLTKLPKISDCSKLLIDIYDNVCQSDSSMCHITEEDWDEYYSENYNEDDIEILKNEIIKYNLIDVIGVYDGEYKIIGYGDLQYKFNDDRDIIKENNVGDNFEI